MKKPIEKTPYVFVYGTLMKGLSNHHCLGRSRMVCENATTEDSYKLVAAGIPYLLEEEGSGYIQGELYEVTERILKTLDLLEGHPEWYERKVINIVNELGDKIKAWAYFMPVSKIRAGATTIPSGNYKDYLFPQEVNV